MRIQMRLLPSFRSAAVLAAEFALFIIGTIPAHAQIQPAPAANPSSTGVPVGNTNSPQCLSTDYKAGEVVTNSIHARRFMRAVFSWQTIAGPAVSTSFSQWLTSHQGYGGNPDAWGYHFGIDVASNVSRKFLSRYAGPAIFHQDDSYRPLGPGHPIGSRFGHVLSHLFITESADQTHRVFNVSAFPASAVNTGLQNLYEPHVLRTVGNNLENFGLDVGVFAAGDAYQEFRCNILKLLPGHHQRDAAATANP
jgi:hypothetical protein